MFAVNITHVFISIYDYWYYKIEMWLTKYLYGPTDIVISVFVNGFTFDSCQVINSTHLTPILTNSMIEKFPSNTSTLEKVLHPLIAGLEKGLKSIDQ